MIRINYGENSMDYKCDNKEKERLKKILSAVVSTDIDALYTMGLVSTEIFVDGRVLFKFEDDIIIDFVMGPNPTIPYKNESLQTYYCKIKLLKANLENINNEIDSFLERVGDTKESTPSFQMPDEYHIIYKGQEYEIIYTNTCLEDMALQKGERAIIINDGNENYNLINKPVDYVNDKVSKDPLVEELLEEGKKIEQSIEFPEGIYEDAGINIDDEVVKENEQDKKE